MFVVMGASGRVGSAVVRRLVEAGQPVRALCRRPKGDQQGVEWVSVDAMDQSALTEAFVGAKGVFVMNPIAEDAKDVLVQADRLSQSVAAALNDAGSPYTVALSSQGAHLTDGTGVVVALNRFEAALWTTGCPLTVLRAAYFMESWVPAAMIAREGGPMPAMLSPTDRRIETVATADVGRAVADYLIDPQPGKLVNLVGPQPCSEEDVATILSDLLGRPVTLAGVPQADIAAFYEGAGLSPSFAAGIAQMYAALNGPGLPFEDAGAEWRRQTTPIKAALAQALDPS